MRADFAGFASASGASENEQRRVLANFMQENISDTDNAKNLMQVNFNGVGNAKNSMLANVGRADI